MAYNLYWMENVEGAYTLIVGSIVGGIFWAVTTTVNTLDTDKIDPTMVYWQHGPLALLSFFGTISLIKLLHKNDMINYLYVMYLVPVLLTLTLFFL